jgi:hypothetical protein
MKHIYLTAFGIFTVGFNMLFSQDPTVDGKNILDSNIVYKVTYLDENFDLAVVSSLNKYKLIQYYSKKKPLFKYYNRNSKNPKYRKNTKIEFIKGPNYDERDSLLDGKVIYRYYDKVFEEDSFSLGKPVSYLYKVYAAPDHRTRLSYIEKTNFKDTYENQPALSYKFLENDFNDVLHLKSVWYWFNRHGKWICVKLKK